MKLHCLVLLLMSLGIYAQDAPFDPEVSKGQLYEYASFANVGDAQLSVEEFMESTDYEYQNLNSENHSVGFTSDLFWVHFKIENSSNQNKTYYLETARPITDKANLYQVSESTIQTFKSGDQIAFSERQVKHRLTIFKLEVPQHSVQEFYLNLRSDGETINMPLELYDQASFWMVNYKQQLFLGLFYGLLFIAGIIYLFFYHSLSEKTFLYYGLYVFSIGFMQASIDGLIFQYVLPSGGFINSRAVMITALLSTFFLLKYCEHFLKVSTQLRGFRNVYNGIYISSGLLFAMVFISPKTLELTYPLSNLNGLVSLVLILTTIFALRIKRLPIDNFFLLGIFFLVVGLFGFVMNNLSLLPNNFYTLNSAKFGSGLEIIFLSLSMTNLIRKLRQDNEKAQALALRKSEEISGLKSYFMSNISHELRTPINAIMGIAELELSDLDNSKEDRKKYQLIKNASLSLLSNVNDILDFEKIEKSELILKAESFNPSIMLNQISDNWKSEARLKGLDYKFEMDHDIPTTAVGDSERFVQIINNVLGNAVKFTDKGQVRFKLKCLNQPDSTCRFSIQVLDTGIGIDMDKQKDVFDSFNQMRLDHKRKFGGVGLGLTITKHLVKLFEGTLRIESTKNEGTTVFIDLSLKYIPKSNIIPANQTDKTEQHVLIVEDNKLNQMVMRQLLKSSDHISFAVVNNGKEALEALQKDVYDLVLMDLQMPIMDGYEATKIIRSGQLGDTIGNIPIIAVTADAMQETRKRVLELGMNDYLTKPVNKELLLQKMESCQSSITLKIA